MANPHDSLILPSSADLVGAFVKDLANVSALLTATQAKPTIAKLFESGGAAATLTFKADRDYFFLGAYYPSGFSVVISVTGRATAVLGAGSGRVSDGVFVCTTTTTAAALPSGIKIPIFKDQTLTVWMGAASCSVCVYLEDQ